MDEHLLLCYDHQNLSSALAKRDIEAFQRALHSPIDVESCENETSTSIFEQACQQPNCDKFIEECIAIGCDVNKVNPVHQKSPINFTTESLSYANLSALIRDPNLNLDTKYASNTPINYFCEKITDNNFNDIFPCIKLLIKHHADLNIGNKRDITPILNILKNKYLNDLHKKNIACYFLDNAVALDIDSKRNGEARSLLSKLMPDRTLPPVQMGKDEWDFNRLIACLRNENEVQFLEGLNSFSEKSSYEKVRESFSAIDDGETLLIAAVKRDLVVAVERMLRLGADINFGIKKPPIEFACIFGHWKVLDLLLMCQNILLDSSEEPLLSIIVRNIGEKSTTKCNYEKCFHLLLNHEKISIDQQDMSKSTALHHAVKYNNRDVITELLKKGSYIGVKNSFNQFAISNISPKVLEEHLDSCISTNELRPGDDNYEIRFDYTNLVPTQTRDEMSRKLKVHDGKTIGTCPNEMAPISFIAQSTDLRHLIKHPLIASFLFLKWHRLAFVFYINFALCAIFSATTVTYILVCYNEDATAGTLSNMLRCISFTLLLYMIIREIFQLILSPWIYCRSWENYLEIVLIICTVLILTANNSFIESKRRTIASATILLIAVEIFLLAGSLPFWSFSTHYVMLITVSKSFLKSLLLYAIILLAFALSFFTLLREPMKPNSSDTAKQSTEGDEDEVDLNKFSNVGLAIMKTLVMSTGEFDAASINFNLNTFSYIFFLVFLFLISTVLFNLLNGLAVSDTQVIKSEAELTNFIQRSQVLARYERILIGEVNSMCYPDFLRRFARSKINVFKMFIPAYRIHVKPNDNNLIFIETAETASENGLLKKENSDHDLASVGCMNGCLCAGHCSRMEKKIIKLASAVLEKVRNEKEEAAEREQYKNKIENIEASLHDLTEKLKILLNK